MSRKFLTPIDLGKNELQNAVVHNIPGTTGPATPVKGQLYFDSTGNILYWYNGSGWVAAQGGAGAVPATTVTGSAVGDASVVGVATTYAREDHKHSREAFGASTAVTTFNASKADGTAITVSHSDHTHGSPVHDAAAHSAIPLSAHSAAAADVAMGGFKITNLGTPSASTDAANKSYVDNITAGLSWKEAVRVASTVNIATLTGLLTVDGITVASNDRVLIKNQTTKSTNGIYLAAAGAWTRALDADAVGELESAAVFVAEGTQADTAWVVTTDGAITPGTTAHDWAQFGAGTAYIAGAGLSLSTNTFNVGATNGSIVVGTDDIGVGYAGSGTTFGTAVTAARSDHNHDATYDKIIAQDCAANVLTTVTHNFNTRDVIVHVYRTTTPWDQVECDIERPSVNAVDVRFATAPTAAAYRIVVTGIDQ